MSEFQRSLAKVLVHEGGFVHHAKDPGGATNQGVIQRTYDAFRDNLGVPRQSVKLLSAQERDMIYRQRYWNLIKGDQLPAGVSYVVFDGAVNSGVSQSVKWLQRALGVKADGVVGPATIAAAQNFGDHDLLIERIIERRFAFLKALKTWPTFGRGWTSRLNGVKAIGMAWAKGADAPQFIMSDAGNARALLSDARKPPSTAAGDTAAGAGGISALIAQTQEQLTPYVEIGFVAKAAAILTIAGMIVAVGGLAYRLWAKRKAAKLADALDIGTEA
jgi:lysozyme family protein